MPTDHKLAVILFADIAGYTAMMQANEQTALELLSRFEEVLEDITPKFQGRIVKYFGDGCLLTFDSTNSSVDCAIALQKAFNETPAVPVRMGLHLGDVVFKNDNVFGDGVNIASRIESLGIPGAILLSKTIRDQIKNNAEFLLVCLGSFDFKNVLEPMEVFAVANPGFVVPRREEMQGKLKDKQKNVRRGTWVALGAVLLLLFIFILYNFITTGKQNVTHKSIAILPFKVMTGSSEDNLGAGIVDDIVSYLSKIKELDVKSNQSSKQYADTKKSLKEIGDELSVTSLVTGTIRQIGNRIHISAQLIDTETENTIWSEQYDKEVVQVFDLETEVATQIVNALKAKLTKQEQKDLSKRYTENVEAYKLYRKGRNFWGTRTKESYDSADVYYKKAIELDPDYPLAYAGLADLYTFNQKGLSQLEAIPIAREYAMKALSLDSTLTEARTTIAFIQFQFDYDWKGAKQALQKIIRDNPNYPIAHIYYGSTLLYTGKIKEGINEIKKALSLDPLSPVPNYVLGRSYYYAHEYDSAIVQIQKAITLFPNFKTSYVTLGLAFLQKELYAKAIDTFSKLPPLTNDQGNSGLYMLAYSYALTGNLTKAKTILEKVPNEFRLQWPLFSSYVYVGMGDTDAALTQLEYAYEARAIGMVFVKAEPVLDPIKNEPRFKALMKKMNLE